MVLTLDGAADAAGVAGAWFIQTGLNPRYTSAGMSQNAVGMKIRSIFFDNRSAL